MGSSFIQYRGFGFWSYDPFIERFAGELATAIEKQNHIEDWEKGLVEHWKFQATGISGFVHLQIDEFIMEERRIGFMKIVQEVIDSHPSEDPIHQTGLFLLRLLDGQLKTDASSPLDYMVALPDG